MLSALLMMFAVFGAAMWVGAISGENSEAALGNMILFFAMSILMFITLGLGLRLRARSNARVDEAITRLLTSAGMVDAVMFATEMQISLDDARNVLDQRMAPGKWQRTELEHYNAQYRPL